ncbi:MAG: sigma-70 family RNA polymerase sigma factor [Chitinophagales bacterium]|nr:sigma-70 family RNA polymerase sigma factor [Chitinophagales bacterium]
MEKELYTEQEIVRQLALGNRLVMEQVYRDHYRFISKWIVKAGGDENDAADVCQESMIVLYEKAKGGDLELTCKLSTYLFAIARNLWYKKVQAKPKSHIAIDDEEEINIEGNYEDDIKAHHEREMHYKQLDDALQRLGEPCSSLLRSFYFKNNNMQQIASDFGYTNADNAKTQKYKCLARLKKIFYTTQVK